MEPSTQKGPQQSVQVFGRKKTATAVAHCKRGNGLIKVNGRPLDQVEPQILRYKLQEPILLLGKEKFACDYSLYHGEYGKHGRDLGVQAVQKRRHSVRWERAREKCRQILRRKITHAR